MTHISPFSADQPGPDPVFSYMRVDELRVNDMVDLENDKYADPDPTNLASPWQFEYATIFNIERETPTCIVVEFSNGMTIGFPPAHTINTSRGADA